MKPTVRLVRCTIRVMRTQNSAVATTLFMVALCGTRNLLLICYTIERGATSGSIIVNRSVVAETAIDPADPTVKGHLPCLGSSQPQPTGPGVDPILNCVNATGNGPGTSHNISCCGRQPVLSPLLACMVCLLSLPDLCVRATFHLVELCVQRFVASNSLACLR